MTCCTGNNRIFCHCGSACVCKGHRYLQMSWDIGHKTFDLPSLVPTPLPGSLSSWLRRSMWIKMTAYGHFPFLKQRLVEVKSNCKHSGRTRGNGQKQCAHSMSHIIPFGAGPWAEVLFPSYWSIDCCTPLHNVRKLLMTNVQIFPPKTWEQEAGVILLFATLFFKLAVKVQI